MTDTPSIHVKQEAMIRPPSHAIPGEVLDNCFENLLPTCQVDGKEDLTIFNKKLTDKHDILQA